MLGSHIYYKNFYHENMQHLKNSNAQKWWNIDGNFMSGITFAERLNNFYILITADLTPLDTLSLPAFYSPSMISLVLHHQKCARNCQV